MAKVKEHQVIEYGDEVQIYIDPRNRTAVPAQVSAKDYRKGWTDVRVGSYTAKARRPDAHGVLQDLLRTYYPGHTTKRSFFDDLSYHSGLNQGTAGKVTNYGVSSPYMVEFSRYTPVATYKLLHPVRTSAPGAFGSIRNKVTSYDWEFIVNNWQPGDDGRLRWTVTHKIKHADGTEEILYESPETSDAYRALALFNDRVSQVGGKPYKLPKDLGKVFLREWKRMDEVGEGKRKIRRTTGRKRSKTGASSSISLGGVR